MLPVLIVIFIALLAIAGLTLLMGITIAREYELAVVFRLGRLVAPRGPGLFFIIPIIETKRMVDLRTVTVDVPPQDAITQDSVTVKVDAVLYYEIVDPVKSVMAVVNHRQAIDLASLTTLRSVIGKHDLAELLKNRAAINATLKGIIDAISDPWGIDVIMMRSSSGSPFRTSPCRASSENCTSSLLLLRHVDFLVARPEYSGQHGDQGSMKRARPPM